MVKIGVDTGGTFTDIIVFEQNHIKVHKILSTPENPSRAIVSGVEDLLDDLSQIESLIHGTTVATNALLERKGALTALIITKGFEDIVEIGRQNRAELYDLFWEKPPPLVNRELRIGVNERMDFRGEVLNDLKINKDELVDLLERFGVESVAISLLNSHANHEHEEQLENILKGETDIPVSRSSLIIPEYREYERTSTTVINAYLVPVVRNYMRSLREKLGRYYLYIMQSNGGVITPDQASDEPVKILTSGPAGGVVGACEVASVTGISNIITYDMGGTSTDISLVEGEPGFTTQCVIDGLPVSVPMINVSTIGAGGGSIAYIDEGGILKVGPESAGADPGPACYGKGSLPTVTDANVVLGRIDPEWFLGGRMTIDRDRSFDAINTLNRGGENMTVEELAEAVIKVANSNMEKALRVISIGKGHDPRDYALVSFGGAGGLHACELASSLEISKVVFPVNPGVLSAMGMLMAEFFKDYSTSCLSMYDTDGVDKVLQGFEELLERAKNDFTGKDISFLRFVDMRYKGQSHELTVDYSNNFITEFHDMHAKRYGYMKKNSPVEFVNARLRAVIPGEKINIPLLEREKTSIGHLKRKVMYNGSYVDTDVYRRDEFYSGFGFNGPAIVLEDTSTLFIPVGYECTVDPYGNIISSKTDRS